MSGENGREDLRKVEETSDETVVRARKTERKTEKVHVREAGGENGGEM